MAMMTKAEALALLKKPLKEMTVEEKKKLQQAMAIAATLEKP